MPAPLTALQILQQFDLVDYTNFSSNSDVEGRAIIGGDITSTNSSSFYTNPNGTGGAPASSGFPALTVFGKIDNNININLNNGGSAYIGGSNAGKINYNGGGGLVNSVPETMSAIQGTMNTLGVQLSALTANSTINSSDPNNVNFTGSGSTTAIFTVSASTLETFRGLNLITNGATSIIINVTGGGAINLSSGLNLNNGFNSDQNHIIWNFENATNVNVSSWDGTILATNATVTNTSQIDGAVIANSFNGQGEVHQYTYEGVLCFMAGTLIATPAGETTVEALRVGDVVQTHDGRTAPIRWIGRQTVSMVFADPLRVLPIRIRTGALGENAPARDLLVSTCHALLVDDILVQAGALVNGASIMREADVPEIFVYYHVELEDHSLLLAEGVPAETFIDSVDRMAFDNWDEHQQLAAEGWMTEEMAYPRATSARQVPGSIKRRLAARAGATAEPMALAS